MTLLLSTALMAPTSAAHARVDVKNVTEVHSAPRGGPAAMSASIRASHAGGAKSGWCSASLVGEQVLVTAAHCVRGPGNVGPTKVHIQIGRHITTGGQVRYLASCLADRWWAGLPDSSNTFLAQHDIAILRTVDCKTGNKNVAKPGKKFGHYRVAAFPYSVADEMNWTYFGYPELNGEAGRLQRVLGSDYDPNCEHGLKAGGTYAACFWWLIGEGGSGGALSSYNGDGTWTLRGVAHREDTWQVDDDIYDTVTPLDYVTGVVFNGFSSAYSRAVEQAASGSRWPRQGDYGIHGSGGLITRKKNCPTSLCVSTGN